VIEFSNNQPQIFSDPGNAFDPYLDPAHVDDLIESLTTPVTEKVDEVEACAPEKEVETIEIKNEVQETELDNGVVVVETNVIEHQVDSDGDLVAIVETSTTEFLVEDEVVQSTEVSVETSVEDGEVTEVERTVTETVYEDEEVVEETEYIVTQAVEDGFVVETTVTETATEVSENDDGETFTSESISQSVTDDTTGNLVELTEQSSLTVADEDDEVVAE